MADEKKARKEKTPRTDLEQDFIDSVHKFRQFPFKEMWLIVSKKALAFKREKVQDEAAEL